MSNPEAAGAAPDIAPSSLAPAFAAPVFAALGDETRLELVSRLCDGEPHSIAQLTEGLGLTRQGVSKHLRILERTGIVASRRAGRETQFLFTPEPIADIRDYLARVSEQWDAALLRLKSFVEE